MSEFETETPEEVTTQPPEPTPASKKKTTNKTVEVDKDVWDAINDKLSKLDDIIAQSDSKNKPYSRAAQENKGTKVRVHFFKDKLVTAYGRTHERRDDNGNPCLFIELITEDGELHLTHMLDYLNDTANAPMCEVVNTKVRQEVDSSAGTVNATIVDWDNFKSYYDDKQVALEVIYKKTDYTVRLPDGREVTVNESVIN